MKITKTLLPVALTAALAVGSTNAMANVLNPFTVNEGSVPGAIANVIANAGGFTGVYTEVVSFDGSGNFATSIKFQATSIYDTSNNPVANQIGSFANQYGLYGLFKATGTYSTSAGVTSFDFNPGGSLNVFIDPSSNTSFTAPGNGTLAWGTANIADDYQIASGAAISGTGTLNPFFSTCKSAVNPSGNGNNCGSFGVNTSFDLTNPDGPLYFTAPNPFYNLAFNSGQLKDFTPTGTQTISGSMDVNYAVPNPGSLALLGIGLLGLSLVRRGRNQA